MPNAAFHSWTSSARGRIVTEAGYKKEDNDMHKTRTIRKAAATAILALGIPILLAGSARAHCDTTRGPIIPEAKAALEKGDVTPILKWVKHDHEAEIKAAFAKAVAVRALGPEAKEVADHSFLETLIRVHRAGEGAPYTGIKDAPVDPVVAMAEKALADGSATEMVGKLNHHLAAAVEEKFNKVVEAAKNKDMSVGAGREYVEAYVTYMHYIEGLHSAMVSAGAHHAEAGAGAAAHEP